MNQSYFARFIGGPQDGLEMEAETAQIRVFFGCGRHVVNKGGGVDVKYSEHFYRLAHRNGCQLVYRYEG